MAAFLRNTSLSSVFLGLFLLSLLFQGVSGNAEYNNEEVSHAQLLGEAPETLSFGRYLVSSHFWQAVMENWQSEYLQFTAFIFLTVWLVQRGSPESKALESAGAGSDAEQKIGDHSNAGSPGWAKIQGGVREWVYGNSLVLTMGSLFLLSWFAHSVAGWSEYNAEQLEHEDPGSTLSWLQYLGSADFWSTSLQNWQSEFLAVGSMVVLSIYLRQRGSPESKPVGEPHAATGVSN